MNYVEKPKNSLYRKMLILKFLSFCLAIHCNEYECNTDRQYFLQIVPIFSVLFAVRLNSYLVNRVSISKLLFYDRDSIS